MLRAILLTLVAATTLSAQVRSDVDLKFEVASVKQNRSGSGKWETSAKPSGFSATNATPEELIIFAYAIPQTVRQMAFHEAISQLVGEPRWIFSERYDVTATAGRAVKPDEVRAMVRALLQERFKLVIHQEHKSSRTYALMLARSDSRLGPQIRRTEIDCKAIAAANAQFAAGLGPRPASASNGAPACGTGTDKDGAVRFGGVTMDSFVRAISKDAGRTVVDKTRLSGNYEITLKYSNGDTPLNGLPDDRPTLFTALRDQLGLKLEVQQNVLDVWVIDHIEHPTPN